MKTVHVFEVKLPNDGWEPLYEEEIRKVLKTHYDPYEIRSYTLSNARNMTIGVLTKDSVYKSIKQAITKNIGLEIVEVAE